MFCPTMTFACLSRSREPGRGGEVCQMGVGGGGRRDKGKNGEAKGEEWED